MREIDRSADIGHRREAESMRQNQENPYADMLELPHPSVVYGHPPMAAAERAAQFAPFAALSGYEEAVEEARREVEENGGEGG